MMVIYLGYVWPFESHTITKMEIFNEIAAIFLCYHMLCFTDWVPRATIRYIMGWSFIFVVCAHLGTHLVILVFNSYMTTKQKAKVKLHKMKSSSRQK